MRIKQDNRNLVLLATVTLVGVVVAGTVALFDPTQAAIRENQVADGRPAYLANRSPVRVVGTPFVPNVNPRER